MAGIFDQLFGVAPPASAAPSPAEKIPAAKRSGAAPRPKQTENGICRSCGTPLFWSGNCYVEVTDGKVSRHRCHGALPEDFENIS